MKRIALRVDASIAIGTGHFMRCLTLADELKKQGTHTRFISRYIPEHLLALLTTKGHEFRPLNSGQETKPDGDLSHAEWLGTTQEADAHDSIGALSDQYWDWLIVDHYALDARWEARLRHSAQKILVIDDIADRRHDCDMLLDQNLYEDMNARYAGKVPDECLLLLGPRYALLREEFRKLRGQVSPRLGSVKRILIFFGGVDADNYTGRAIQALVETGIMDFQVDVVIGAQHPCRESIEATCRLHHLGCHVQTERMAELMAAADLSIGAGGVATWERCCLGLPALVISTADNQRKQIQDAALKGLVYSVVANGNKLHLAIRHHVRSLMENECLRRLLSRNGMHAVDGRGAVRIARMIGCSEIEIRTATADDSERMFVWRNHPAIRAVSRNADPIEWIDHNHWLTSVLSDQSRCLLIGELDGAPVGVVRFDIHSREAEVSIYLVPGVENSGCGQGLLQSAEVWMKKNRREVNTLRAQVLGANERSHHLFLAAGYEVEATSYLRKFH